MCPDKRPIRNRTAIRPGRFVCAACSGSLTDQPYFLFLFNIQPLDGIVTEFVSMNDKPWLLKKLSRSNPRAHTDNLGKRLPGIHTNAVMPPRTRYPVAGLPSGAGFAPAGLYDLAQPQLQVHHA